MVDVHTPEARSRNMRAIRNKDTKPELLIRKALRARGFWFRLGGAPRYRSTEVQNSHIHPRLLLAWPRLKVLQVAWYAY